MSTKDFTDRNHTEPQTFMIDDDLFECARVLPAGVGRKFAQLQDKSPVEQFDGIGEILDIVLLPESAERFAARMVDPQNPISMEQIGQIIEWLVEEYGGRPTTPSANSLPSPTGTGTSSTDGAPVEVSMG